jgi:hypothetical protein
MIQPFQLGFSTWGNANNRRKLSSGAKQAAEKLDNRPAL